MLQIDYIGGTHMIEKRVKKLISFALSGIMVMGMSMTAFAAEDGTITEILEGPIYYDIPQTVDESPESEETLIISSGDIENMSAEELAAFLSNQTPLYEDEISQIVAYYQSEDYQNDITPMYGIYDHPEWYIKPYVKSSTKRVTYSRSWIGIDAYRSSVGMTKGKTESKTIKFTLGYTGSKEIKEFDNKLSASFETSTTTTVSESQTCPAWTTMNWRPYATYWEDEYYGKMKITTIVPTATGVVQNIWYEEHTGTNKRLINDTTEVWSRVNSSHNINAVTPTPPTGKPNV